MAPRSKVVTVGGRDFVVRPLLGKVAAELASREFKDAGSTVEFVAAVLGRTAPDITKEWLLEHGDVAEYKDVIDALTEVTNAPKAGQGEAPAP